MRTFAFLLILLLALSSSAQNTIGLPEVANYSRTSYHAGTQSWQIRQDGRGVLYFANNDGLLTFDGNYWKTYPLPNKTIVRSVEPARDGRIYIGGQDELGYFAPGPSGNLVYHSLKAQIPAQDRSFADVWNIVSFDNQLFFRTSNKIFQFTGDKVTVSYSADWRFMGLCGSQLLVQDAVRGLLRFRNGLWEPLLPGANYPKGFLVTGVLPYNGDTLLIASFRHGCFLAANGQLLPFNSGALASIANKLIYTAAEAGPGEFLLGTTLEGCYIINREGRITQSFTRREGLQNNNILSVFFDRDRNLWLGLDNGIDFITYDSPVRHIYPSLQNEGSGYTALEHDGRLYLGTSNGLYSVPVPGHGDLSYTSGEIRPVPNARGQVWNLSEVNGLLLMGHHEGAFRVNADGAAPVDNSSGFWTFLPYSNVLPSALMVTGTYNGIRLYHCDGTAIGGSIAAPFESARFVTVDNNTRAIWVAHPYKGIYQVRFNDRLQPTVRRYSTESGLTNINNNYLFKVRNHIVVTTENGIFEYDGATDRFRPSAYFHGIFDRPNIRYMREDGEGNIWFVHDRRVGVLEAGKTTPLYLPELTDQLVNGFEHIYPIDPQNIIVGSEKGFIHVNLAKYRQQASRLQSLITGVRAFGRYDTLLYGGFGEAQKASVGNYNNSVHFEYSATAYGRQRNIEYSYQLQGYDNRWSEWTKKVEKEYGHLPPGTYTFRVKARNSLGRESGADSYTFTVLPPWYQSWWAYTIYALLAAAGVFALVRFQRRKFAEQQARHEEEQSRLQYLHQLELEKNEKEIIRLKNEKLESEIDFKNSELAGSAMHLVQKGELMGKLKEELTRLRKKLEGESAEDLKKILRILSDEEKMNDDWDNFAQHFDKVHGNFITALKKQFPALTPNELKLSAYLRMNLSSKEVAQLMNISVRGVEISRYRLRKKLGIPTETNLFEFLIGIHPEEGSAAPVA